MSETQNSPFAINRLRVAVFGFACVLGSLAAWILVAEALRPKTIEFTTDAQFAVSNYAQRDAAITAARVGLVRGDLWSEAAFAYGDMLWSEEKNASNADGRHSIRLALTETSHCIRATRFPALASFCCQLFSV